MHVLGDGGPGSRSGGGAPVGPAAAAVDGGGSAGRGVGGGRGGGGYAGGQGQRLVGRGPLLQRVEHELSAGRTVALEGVAGVGKTRVLDALARRHAGPVLCLGDVATTAPAAGVQAQVRGPAAVAGPAGARPVLVLVDDAPLLDEDVIEQVRALERSPDHRVVTTSRSAGADDGAAWWTGDGWRHLEVAPLDRIATAQRLQDVLGAFVEPELAHAVWVASGGHPVGIVEVLRDARETGCVELDVEAWRLVAPLPVRRLTELVGDRVARLGGAARAAADVLALASELPIHLASSLVDPAGVRELEARGLVRFGCHDRGGSLSLAEPMVAEVLLAQLSADRRRVLLERLVGAFERCGSVDARVARWRLEVGGWDAEDLEAAACRAAAADDLALAEALAVRAVELGAGHRSQVVLGVALARRGEGEGANPILRSAAGDADDPAARERVAVGEAHVQAIGLGRWDRGIQRLAEQAGSRSSAELVALRALFEALRGTPNDAARSFAGPAHLEQGEAGLAQGTELAGQVATVAAAVTAGSRLEHAPAVLDARPDAARGSSNGTPDGPAGVSSTVAAVIGGTELLTGRDRSLSHRLAAARPALEAALRRADGTAGWWLAVTGWLHLDAGDLHAARGRLIEALLATQRLDPLRLRPRILADLAVVAAAEGSPAEAEGRLGTIGVDRDTSPLVAVRCAIAQALVDVQLAGTDAGAAVAVAAGRDALDVGLLREALDAWHLAVRLGASHTVLAELARAEAVLAERARSDAAVPGFPADHPDVVAVRRHAERLAAGDGDGLAAVARDLAGQGRCLVAAEAAAQAARLGGDGAASLAAGMVAACPSARTPALEGFEPVTLSPRRRQVGRLAVRGDEGRTIAATLGLSLRTVENHLGALYRDLGVANRWELRRVYRGDRPPFA